MSQPTDTPIVADVVEGEEVEDVVLDTEVKIDRDAVMASIVEKRNEEIKSDLSEDAPDKDLDLSEEIEDDVDVVAKKEEPEKVVVKIDGVDKEVTPEEIREYQVNKAADLRLREAADERKKLEAREAAIAKREAEIAKASADREVSPEATALLAKKLVKSTFDEDEVGAAEVIKEIMASKQPQPAAAPTAISTADINAGVEEVLYRREQKKAISKFESEYSFLATNMRDVVNKRSIVERTNDPDASIWDIIQRSAEYVKTEVAKEFGASAPETGIIPDLNARREAKKGSGNTVKAKTTIKSKIPNPDAVKPLTPHESFLEIQRGRGQG